MRIMKPRIGFALVSAALMGMGATGTMFAAQAQAAQGQAPTCYSTCPPRVDLEETFHVLRVGSEEIEDFYVRVGPDVIGAENTPTGTVTIKTGSTVLCTIILVHGHGSCRPGANALPAGHYEVVAYYSGDSNFSPSQSRPRQLQVTDRGHIFGFGFGGLGFSSFLRNLFGTNVQTASAPSAPGLRSHGL